MWRRPAYPGFAVALSLLLSGAMAGGVLLVATHRQRLAAERRLDERTAELRALGSRTPAPTPDNVAAVEAELARARGELAALRTQIAAVPEPVASPATRTDAFFAFAAFAERMRTRAAAAQVAVGAEERFGFGAFAREGPALPALPRLVRQQRWLEALLPMLFEAGPEAFSGAQRTGSAGGEGAVVDPGVFVVDPRLSLRSPDGAPPDGFRLRFAGQTLVLRRFLNAVAASPLPFVVRAVEVSGDGEPLPPNEGPRPAPAVSASRVRPPAPPPDWLVARNRSQFTVTVEVGVVEPAGGGSGR